MKRTLVLVLAAAAFGGCKKDSKKDPAQTPGPGPGSAGAQAEPPKTRPSQQPQPTLPPLELPPDPKRAEKAKLGHALFFDKQLSGASDRACYSCHLNEDGTGGHDPIAIGSGDKKLTRHSPTLWNVGFLKAFYWDGRAPTLEKQVEGAWGGGNMGGAPAGAPPEKVTEALDKRAAELAKIPGYKKLFEEAFPAAEVKAEHVIGALAEYVRTIRCDDTAFDRYAGGDRNALSEQQQRGFDVFSGKGGCVVCHMPPYFSSAMAAENQFYNVGIGTKDVPEDKVDIGRKKVTNAEADWAAFKPPSLRHVTKSAPYFHDGSVAKLEDAVKLMASGGIANKHRHALVADKQLTDAELADVVAFLGALECGGKLEAPPPIEGAGEAPKGAAPKGKAGKAK